MAESKGDDSKCMHLENGEVEGYLTCFLCGSVLEYQTFENTHSLNCLKTHSSNLHSDSHMLEEIYYKNIISYELFNQCNYYVMKWKKADVPLRKYHVPFSIYYCSRKINFPISLREISELFKISVKEICMLEKYLDFDCDVSFNSYLNKYASILGVSFQEQEKIKKQFSPMCKNFNCSINIFCAAVLFIHTSDLDSIANVTKITKFTIKKWGNYIKNHLV